MDKNAFGRKLRRLRLERGLTTKALAERAGTARSTVTRYEAGAARPRAATVARLATALKMDPGELLNTTGRTRRETAHDREVYKLLNTAENLDTPRLKTLTAFARFLYKQKRQAK